MPKSSEAVLQELHALYREWFSRVGPDPGDYFQRVLAPDWVYIDFDGVVRGKSDYEPYIAGVPAASVPHDPRDLRVRLFGDVAVVDGSYAISGPDMATDTVLRFTAVWIERDGRWVALAHHTSAVSRSQGQDGDGDTARTTPSS